MNLLETRPDIIGETSNEIKTLNAVCKKHAYNYNIINEQTDQNVRKWLNDKNYRSAWTNYAHKKWKTHS